jgi:hypothetical protein
MGFFGNVGKRMKKFVGVGKKIAQQAKRIGKNVPQGVKDQAWSYGVKEAEKRSGYTMDQAKDAYSKGQEAYGAAKDMKRQVEGGDYGGAAQSVDGHLKRHGVDAREQIRRRLQGN